MRAEEAQKRYSDTIEMAIGKAKLSRERVAIEAQDGADIRIRRHRLGRQRGSDRREYPARRSPAGWNR
jgi:hypothetical protein